MTRFCFLVTLALMPCLGNLEVFAQNKSQAYYNTHEREIFSDAQQAFNDGDYERAIKLCQWYYIIVGDVKANDLKEKALQCSKLTIEMNALASYGQMDAAKEKAQAIMALNPYDKLAESLNLRDTKVNDNGHEWVDLGLSVKWATCNVGASSPGEYGSYFAWGETEPKNEYTWATLKYCADNGDTFSKYNTASNNGTVDNKTVLDRLDDVASVNWGGGWRMPTSAEFEELVIKCTWTWTSRDGNNGYKVAGSNGNSIFLPAAGQRYSTFIFNNGGVGYYWSSSICEEFPRGALYLNFFKNNNVYHWVHLERYYGNSVRPVIK